MPAEMNNSRLIYAEADVGILPMKRDFYMDFAVHVKMFEYMGYGLPVISTDCVETKRMIDRYECGLTCKDDPQSLADAIARFYSDPEKIEEYRNNVATGHERKPMVQPGPKGSRGPFRAKEKINNGQFWRFVQKCRRILILKDFP